MENPGDIAVENAKMQTQATNRDKYNKVKILTDFPKLRLLYVVID